MMMGFGADLSQRLVEFICPYYHLYNQWSTLFRITNLQNVKQPPLLQPPQRTTAGQGAVQMRIKTSQTSGDRLSQSKSMVLQESDLPQKPISRHRRNQSQHNVAVLEPFKPGGKIDMVQLCGALIEWTTEKSSRKNVFQVTTNTGSEYLLQTDNYSTANKWYDGVKKAIDSSTKADGGFPLRKSNSTDYLPRHSSLPGYGSASPSAKQRNPVNRRSINMFGSSKLKHSASDSADKNGVKNRLKKFIIRRPSMKTLQEKGLIKDRVFGCHLLTLCQREGTTVPKFVRVCVEAVDKRGLEVDGIYRVSGNLATIQKLRFLVDQEEDLDLDNNQWEDIHVVTGALKMFFRELPEPLFPFRFFQPFVEAVKIKESKQKMQAVKKLIQQLPKPNQDTMKLLFSHLHRLLKFSRQNLMSTQSIGIVFGPTLMWPELDAGNMAVNMVYQNQIVEFILIETQEIFDLNRN
ncbi:Rho GTPase-activating protein 15 ArhGAP15 Rho-type GTPase-activating protein 15 [Channa argus]|uniref:Rho GTPase-activating protein 15 n=1 Tax=Channa argus TaxID=215402 RepID=A0A6G1PWF2_CHAAH|nr:Rho GTPase-activating protein 15 ArhGAP15 Rho-type GTPase-activating protein 15 [Channa argus]